MENPCGVKPALPRLELGTQASVATARGSFRLVLFRSLGLETFQFALNTLLLMIDCRIA